MIQRSSSSRHHTLAAVVLVAVIALVAGCGSSSTKTGAGSTATSQPTGSVIKVGLLAATTSVTAVGQVNLPKVASAWATWTNDHGGINGHPVEIIFSETAGDPSQAMTSAAKLVEQDKVIAMVVSDTSTEGTWAPYLQQKKIPVVGGFGFSSEVWGKLDNFFTLKTDVMGIVAGPLLAAKSINAKSFGAVVCSENPSCTQAEQLYKPLLKQIDVQYAGLAKAGMADASYTAQCLALMQAGADYIQINLAATAATRLIEECVGQGYRGTFGLADGTVLASAMKDAPADAKVFGVIDGFPWWSTTGPAADFQSAMRDAKLNELDFGNSAYTATWSSLETFRKAMASAPANPTSADVFAGMYGLKDEDLGGLLSQKVSFTAGQPAPAILCYWFYKYEDGTFTTMPDGSPTGNNVTSGDLKSSCFKPGA